MTRPNFARVAILVGVISIGSAAVAPGVRTWVHQREALEQRMQVLRRQAEETEQRRQRATSAETALRSTEQQIAAIETRLRQRAEQSPTEPRWRWTQRVKRFQARLAATPGAYIDEFRLLTARDWLQAAYDGDESRFDESVRRLRYVARRRLAETLANALSRWAGQHAMLPASVGDLAPLLPPAVDAAMLSHYELVRSGPIGSRTEPVLQETGTADMPLVVHLDGFNANRTSSANDESVIADVLGTVGAHDHEVRRQMEALAGGIRAIGPVIQETLGDDFEREVAPRMKSAVAEYQMANGRPPENVAQLLPHLQLTPEMLAKVRVALAHFDYLFDHEGRLPATLEDLRPYLSPRISTEEILRGARLKHENDGVSLNYSAR